LKITTVSYTFDHYFYDILILEELKQALNKSGNHEGDDAGVGHLNELDNEIDQLKAKIKEIEDKLRELKGKKSTPVYSSPPKGDDSTFIYELNDRLGKLEGAHGKTVERVTDHLERIERIEISTSDNKEKISLYKQDIGEISDALSDKVD
jgi:predicted  nucleic acid-binding Zn-ribbon protein